MIGFVYMLYSNDIDKVYIGSTIKEPGQRYNEHIFDPEHTSARQLLNMSKDVNFKILEVVQFSDISELRKREMSFINSTDKCVNIVKSYTSQEEKRLVKEQKMQLLESIETSEIRIR